MKNQNFNHNTVNVVSKQTFLVPVLNYFKKGVVSFIMAFVFLSVLLAQPVSEPLQHFEWQRDHARITETGDIELTQQSFRFVTGQRVRYIDYESGNDANEGSKARPWKHHPWDANATGNAATARGIDTYIFKGGVIYRGQLIVSEQGLPMHPIRLTRDPSWGQGPAIIAGSEMAKGWTRGADHPDIPRPEKVWKVKLEFAPRSLWMINNNGSSTRIPLARHPNWKANPEGEDYMADWFSWTNEGHPFERDDDYSANDSKNLKGKPADFIEGAIIYPEFGWVIGNPYASPVTGFDPQTGAVRFQNRTGGSTAGGPGSIIMRYMRYYLEDKPHYLDDPDGEFWFDKKGEGGILYLRLPDGMDPNQSHLEAGRLHDLIYGREVRHLEITGLDFRWTTPHWDLHVVPWDFSTKPFGVREDANPASIRLWGQAVDVRIANCNFEDVVMGIKMNAVGQESRIEDIMVEDNSFLNNDTGAAHFSAGHSWGYAHPVGILDDVQLFRNHAVRIGYRPSRYEFGCTFDLVSPFRAHIAGNLVEYSGAQGINVYGGKINGMRGDVPFVRVLIHQNKIWRSMQFSNDFGGIEGWQHGPMYIFNNLSHDARGLQEAQRRQHGNRKGFGHAYYLDGGFKNYLFNNIAWGLSNDPSSKQVNCAAFQEIHSFQNVFFNNTAYNYAEGSRRQAPGGGRNKYLGNVFQDISTWVFLHDNPSNTLREPNAQDVRKLATQANFNTNAYDRNIFNSFSNCPYVESGFGSYLPNGSWLNTPDDFRQVLEQTQTMVTSLGIEEESPPLRDPASGDFRLSRESAAIDNGAVTFVPWALHGVVAEWNFYHLGGDHTTLIDEHWYAADYLAERNYFHHRPTFPLTAVNVDPDDYIDGPLENFVCGALKLAPTRRTYATITNAKLNRPFTAVLPTRARHGQDTQPRELTFTGPDLKNPEIHSSNFLIEVYFKATSDGLLISKKQVAGYELRVRDGQAVFSVEGTGGARAELTSQSSVSNGQWRHLIAEADRATGTLTLYIDGKQDATGRGIGAVSLANEADLFVGGTPTGDHLDGVLEFMRIARGTLADAYTTIEELYTWQFNGPAKLDMRGAIPKGKGRDAGALESLY